MRIETRLITDYRGDVIEAVVILHQNDTSMVIAEVHRNIIDEERVERLVARTLRKAAEWVEAGEVNLTVIEGGGVCRVDHRAK